MKRKGSFRIGVGPVFSESKAFKDLPFQNRCFEGHISSGFSRRGSLSHVRVAAEACGGGQRIFRVPVSGHCILESFVV